MSRLQHVACWACFRVISYTCQVEGNYSGFLSCVAKGRNHTKGVYEIQGMNILVSWAVQQKTKNIRTPDAESCASFGQSGQKPGQQEIHRLSF